MSAVSSASRWLLALFATTVLLSIGVAATFEGHSALAPRPLAGTGPRPGSASTTADVGSTGPAIVVFVAESRTELDQEVTCVLDRSGAGRVAATTAGGMSFNAILDPAVSALILSGPMGDATAIITAISAEGGVLLLEADPPGIRATIPLPICRPSP